MRSLTKPALLAVVMFVGGLMSTTATWADNEVGYVREWVSGPDGSQILMDLFVPIDSELAETLPAAEYEYYVPGLSHPSLPINPEGFVEVHLGIPIAVTGDLFAGFTDGVTVRSLGQLGDLVEDAPTIVWLPASQAPGWTYHISAIRLASEGYVVAVITLPWLPETDQLCKAQAMARSVLDHLEVHPELDLGDFFGIGHSLGGSTLTALTSDVQLCPGAQKTEDRILASALLDPFIRITTAEQTQCHDHEAIMFSQWCQYDQMLYQIEADIPRIDLVGYAEDPTDGSALELGSYFSWNHLSLFSQGCTIAAVVEANGGGDALLPPFGDIARLCSNSQTQVFELRSIDQVVGQITAFFAQPAAYPVVEQPDDEWASIIDARAIPHQQPGGYANVCYGVEGVSGPSILSFVASDLTFRRSQTSGTVTCPETASVTDEALPGRFGLTANYPNPVSSTTTISYSLPTTSEISLTVVDLFGRMVEVLDSGTRSAGEHRVHVDVETLASGSYFYRLQVDGYVETKSLVVAK